jgi:excisionase family DNA binding protein
LRAALLGIFLDVICDRSEANAEILVGEETMRRGQQQTNGTQINCGNLCDGTEVADPSVIPFVQRLTCTIAQACEVTGLGRTKLYELIGHGQITTTTIGRRRLVLVRSLLSLIAGNSSHEGRA